MKDLSAANKAIKGAVESKDYAIIEAKAKDINGTADKIVSLSSPMAAPKAKPKQRPPSGKNPMILPKPRRV